MSAADLAGITPREFRRMCREGRYEGVTRGVALGYLQCNLVVLRRPEAYDFLVYCQRNQRACPVLEICDAGDPEPRRIGPRSDLRTDLPATPSIARAFAARTSPMPGTCGSRTRSRS